MFLLSYLDRGIVAVLLHMQQSAALAARPELDLQAAGAARLGGGALQGPSQQDVPFGSLLQGIVEPARAIQGQGGVCRGVCGGERKSSVTLSDFTAVFTANCKTYISTLERADAWAPNDFS